MESHFPDVVWKIDVLDIPDRYKYMQPELIELLHERVEQVLRKRGMLA